MADTYRPLTAEDPVGTEVYLIDSHRPLGTLLARSGTTPYLFAWVQSPVVRPIDDYPKTFLADRLRVRVPDPWGELLAKAKAIQGACYLDDGVLERKGVTTIKCAALVDLFAAIAAVEAAKKGASDDER